MSECDLDFCLWLHRNFDEIAEALPIWNGEYEVDAQIQEQEESPPQEQEQPPQFVSVAEWEIRKSLVAEIISLRSMLSDAYRSIEASEQKQKRKRWWER